jgi:hypothetical protein
MTLFMILNIPSILMVILGYRKNSLMYVEQNYLVIMETLTKVSFGFVVLPLIYLIGYWQKNNSDNVYKSLTQIMFVLGHLINMVFLSIINFISTKGDS